MSDIRFNNWLHQSGTGGVYQDGSGNVGIGTSVPSATLDVGGTINANTAVISGNLTVEGVLTYDDVTNIDSVGVVTARDGIDITSGDIVLNKSRSDTHASLIIDKPDAGSGTIKFYNNGSDSGYIQHTNAEHLHYYLPSGSGNHVFYTNGANVRLSVTNTGIQVTGQIDIGTTTIYGTGDISMGDNDKLRLGGGDDLRIYHNGSHSYIDETGDGNLYIRNGTKNSIFARTDGEVILYHNNNNRVETTNTGASITGNLNISGHTYLNDNRELIIGAGQDLKLYHNGSNNYIDNTSDLYVRVNGSETAIYATANGKVALNYDSSNRIETTATGVEVSGATKTDTLEVTQEYPSIRPTLDLNFAATKVLDDRITFTRDGVGTYIDENGILKYASNNTPRFDHDPVTGESLGLLIEESRTNILYGTPSQSNTVNTYNLYNSLTGEYNATRLAKNASGNDQSHGSWNWNGNLSTTSFVMSAFVKKINHASFFMQIVSSGVGDNLYVYYNIDTGVTSHTDFSSPGNLTVTKSIENYPDGWFRLVARVQGFSNAALHSGFRLGFAHPSNNSQQYQNSSHEVLVFGAQAEVGDFATSYIPTHESTTSVTRSDDNASIKGTNFSDIYNETEGTIFAEFNTKVNTGTTSKWAVSLRDPANNNNYIAVKTYAANMQALQVQSGGSSAASISNNNSVVIDQFRRVAGSFKLNDFDAADGGTLLTGDTSGAMPTGITQMDIGRGWTNSDQKLEGHIKSIKYYRKKLPDAQLQGLTQQ